MLVGNKINAAKLLFSRIEQRIYNNFIAKEPVKKSDIRYIVLRLLNGWTLLFLSVLFCADIAFCEVYPNLMLRFFPIIFLVYFISGFGTVFFYYVLYLVMKYGERV